MKYDFDAVINRRRTGSLKWDTVDEGVIPLWVADMDFAAPPELMRALTERAVHPFYGYNRRRTTYLDSIASWYRERYGVAVDPAEILPGPGTVLSLGMAVRAFTKAGDGSREADGVLVMTPVYTPFYRVITENKRQVVEAPVSLDGGGRFVFDTAALEKAVDSAVAAGISVPLMFFCSPHNPGGRVWTAAEIEALLEFAERRGIIVAADEIHGDFVYGSADGGRHGFVSAAVFSGYAARIVTVSGANKSFNLGGLHASHFVIRDKNLRKRVLEILDRSQSHEPDVFAELAVETCYRNCGPWLDELKSYLRENLETAADFLNGVPGVKTWMPDGTYLLWTDIRGLAEKAGCKNDMGLVSRLEKEAKVKITHGSLYGEGGRGYARINAASPRSLLMEGLGRIKDWAERRL